MKDIIPSLQRLNEMYSMFSCITEDTGPEDAEFLFSVADSITTKDMQTRYGSEMLNGYGPGFDATSVEKMRTAGGKLIGKTNTDEFGSGGFGTTSAYGIPKNPFDTGRSAGDGSACAASVIPSHISLASAVCRSASFCGVYGMMPTYGRISRYGLMDRNIGLISSDPGMIEKFLPIVSGRDIKDPASCVQPDLEIKGKKIMSVAVPEESLAWADKDVLSCFNSSLDSLRSMGTEVKMISMPSLKYALPTHIILSTSEFSTDLARFAGMRYGRQDGDLSMKFDDYFTSCRTKYFGEETKKRILLGTYVRMKGSRERYYSKALKTRAHMISAYKKVLSEHDAILTPTMPSVSPKFSEISGMSPAAIYGTDIFTCIPELTGMPCLSAPCGYGDSDMPAGMLMVTDHWNEDQLITFAKDWDKVFRPRRPEVSA